MNRCLAGSIDRLGFRPTCESQVPVCAWAMGAGTGDNPQRIQPKQMQQSDKHKHIVRHFRGCVDWGGAFRVSALQFAVVLALGALSAQSTGVEHFGGYARNCFCIQQRPRITQPTPEARSFGPPAHHKRTAEGLARTDRDRYSPGARPATAITQPNPPKQCREHNASRDQRDRKTAPSTQTFPSRKWSPPTC